MKNANPSIEDLKNPERFELIAQINHQQIKEFVIEQLTSDCKIIRLYMYYQVAMIAVGAFFLVRSVLLAFKSITVELIYTAVALVFSLTILVVVHELIHGFALKLAGAPKVSFGGYLRKFIFYAEADRFVINRRQFAFIALAPLVVVKLVTLAGIILFFNHPVLYSLIFVMSAHSLFCAGDIGLLSLFYKYQDGEIFNYDSKAEKTSYYFRKISSDIL